MHSYSIAYGQSDMFQACGFKGEFVSMAIDIYVADKYGIEMS